MTTFYDADILAEERHPWGVLRMIELARLGGRREGYLARAAEEDAVKKALVEALRDLADMVAEREQGNHDLDDLLDAADAVLALAEKGA